MSGWKVWPHEAHVPLTPKWHRIFWKEETLQHVFIFEFFFGEIDGYRCKSNYVKGGCSRVHVTSKILNRPFFIFNNRFCIKSTCQHWTTCMVLGLFLASFLGAANNTPTFVATSTKKSELHILAPFSTWKNCKNYKNVVLDVVYIDLSKLQTI